MIMVPVDQISTSVRPPERNDNFMYVNALELNGPASLPAGGAFK